MDIATADRLVQLRKSNGLSQEALAAKLGVSRQAVSKWERAEASPDTDNLIALADLYSLTLDQLLNAENDKYILETENTENHRRERLPRTQRQQIASKMFKLPFPLLAVLIYLIIGFNTKSGWHPWWLLLSLIPIYYHLAAAMAIRTKKARLLAMPIPEVVITIYLLIGFCFNFWHPTWLIMFIIPIYYWFIAVCYKEKKKTDVEPEQNTSNE